MEHVNFGVKGLSSHHCEAIEDAINNYDRLTEENAKLRELVELAFNEGAEEGFHGGGYFSMSKSQELLNQLKDQNNDK